MKKFYQLHKEQPDAEALLEILDSYGINEKERERVQLAILKLSERDPERLRHYVDAAKMDYRDVLAWAEYPEQMETGATDYNSPPELIQEIRKRDREQYNSWLEE